MAIGRFSGWVVCALLLAAFGALAAPGVARAQCPEANPTYTDACGPTFVLPGWGDAGGWTDPSQYSTIQLADVNGDGSDELLGAQRPGPGGLVGSTRASGSGARRSTPTGRPQALTGLRARRLPGETPATDWTQAAVLLDDPGLRRRRPAGRGDPGALRGRDARLQVHPAGGDEDASTAAAGRESATGGRVQRRRRATAMPSLYSTIHVGQFTDRGRTADVRAHEQLVRSRGTSGAATAWTQVTRTTALGEFDIDGLRGSGLRDSRRAISTCCPPTSARSTPAGTTTPRRSSAASGLGVSSVGHRRIQHLGSVQRWPAIPASSGRSPTSRVPSPVSGAPDDAGDCPFSARGASGAGSGDCLGSSPSYYETLHAADIDGRPGATRSSRGPSDGLRVKTWDNGTSRRRAATCDRISTRSRR